MVLFPVFADWKMCDATIFRIHRKDDVQSYFLLYMQKGRCASYHFSYWQTGCCAMLLFLVLRDGNLFEAIIFGTHRSDMYEATICHIYREEDERSYHLRWLQKRRCAMQLFPVFTEGKICEAAILVFTKRTVCEATVSRSHRKKDVRSFYFPYSHEDGGRDGQISCVMHAAHCICVQIKLLQSAM